MNQSKESNLATELVFDDAGHTHATNTYNLYVVDKRPVTAVEKPLYDMIRGGGYVKKRE